MIKLGGFTKSFVANTVGKKGGKGRMYNLDQDTYLVGYAEVNQQAATPFTRTRVHKGFFACDTGQVREGELVEDRVDQKIYLVMSLKNEYLNDETVYLDGTLYYCDVTVTVQRFEGGTKDTFGRSITSAPVTLADGLYAMCAPQNFSTMEQPDRTVAQDKLAVYMQQTFRCTQASANHAVGDILSFKENDRLIASNGDTYVINSIDKASLVGIAILKVDTDVR